MRVYFIDQNGQDLGKTLMDAVPRIGDLASAPQVTPFCTVTGVRWHTTYGDEFAIVTIDLSKPHGGGRGDEKREDE